MGLGCRNHYFGGRGSHVEVYQDSSGLSLHMVYNRVYLNP